MDRETPPQNPVLVDIADMRVSADYGCILATSSLGACIGVAIYDPLTRVGGLLHYILPEARTNPDRARLNPFLFADTGIPMLFREAYKYGAVRGRLQIKLAGGANVLDPIHYFNIGKRNYLAARRLFFKNNLLITSELVGGYSGKSMRLYLEDGRVEVRLPDGEMHTL